MKKFSKIKEKRFCNMFKIRKTEKVKKLVAVAVSVAIVGMSVPIMATSGENSAQTQAEPNRATTGANNAVGDTFTDSQGIEYKISADTATEKTCYVDENNTGVSVNNPTIPDQAQDSGTWYNVTSIADSAFERNTNLTGTLTIGDNVTTIGESAFEDCSGLTSIAIGSSPTSSQLTSIGNRAFNSCFSLTGVTIPDSVTSIGNQAFQGCYDEDTDAGLESVSIGAGVTSIGYSAFGACQKLTTITVADGNTHYKAIDNVLFEIDNNKNPILLHTYPAGKPDTTYTIPDSVTSIGVGAFSECRSLTSVTIPDSVTSIGESAFNGCSNLTSVTIPDGVTSIEEGTFEDCSNLTSVTIGSGVTSIGDYAFDSCYSLQGTPTEEGTIGPLIIPDSVTSIGDCAFQSCYGEEKKTGLESVTIGSGVTSIGDSAFYGCAGLESVTIGSGVTSIGDSAFQDCTALQYVLFATANSVTWGADEGTCDTFDGTPLVDSTSGAHFHTTQAVYDSMTDAGITLGDGVFAKIDKITADDVTGDPPANLTARVESTSGDTAQIAINWDAVASNGAVDGYQVQKSLDGTTWENVTDFTSETSATDSVKTDDISKVTYKVAGSNVARVGDYGTEDPFSNEILDQKTGTFSGSVPIERDSHSITYNYDTDKGTVTGAESAQEDVEVEFTVTPKEGYTVKDVTSNVEGLKITDEGNGKYSFTMPTSDVTINVTFEGTPHTITIPGMEHGSVTAQVVDESANNLTDGSAVDVKTGDTVKLTVTPDEGYQLKEGSLKVTEATSGKEVTLNDNTFVVPNNDVTVEAEFESNSPSPTPTPTPTPIPTPDDGGGTGGGGTGTGGNAGGANATGTSYASGSAKTGDNAMAGVAGLTALAGLGVAVMLRKRRK